MALDLTSFGKLRPFLFHLTHADNIARLSRTRLLESATRLAAQTAQNELTGTRRREHVQLTIGDEKVVIRDQAPLHKGNMALTDNWTFEQFVRLLNSHVFFWPGTEKGPISYGVRHFQRYEAESPVMLRIGLSSLLEANPKTSLLLAKCNSGSPRWSGGFAAPRGPRTFVPAAAANFRGSEVIEVTALDSIVLPDDTARGSAPGGPWTPLFA